MNRLAVLLTMAALAVGGCGSTPGERAITGGGLGAAGGAAVGAVTNLGVLEGALIGGATGAVAGAVTNKNQINLGKPVWRSGDHDD